MKGFSLLKYLINYFLPEVCPNCRKELLEEDFLCKNCMGEIAANEGEVCSCCGSRLDMVLDICSKCIKEDQHLWTSSVCVFAMNKAIHDIILNFKYKNEIELFPFLAQKISEKIQNEGLKFELITAVPLHFMKYFLRGYNQSVLLAKKVSKLTNTTYGTLLIRNKYTKTQTSLSGEERRKNLQNVFLAKKRAIIKNKDILLIDDVYTTGSTLRSASKALIDAGASKVTILVLARR